MDELDLATELAKLRKSMQKYEGEPQPYFGGLPIGLYARLSQNPDGSRDSVKSQLTLGGEAAAKQFPEVDVLDFHDDDLSAADADVWRQAFYDLAVAVAARRVGLILARNQERLSRNKMIWQTFVEIANKAGFTHYYIFENGVLEAHPLDDLVGDINMHQAKQHSVKSKKNSQATLKLKAGNGEPPAGIPTGYVRGRNDKGEKTIFPIPEYAKALREAGRRALAGETLVSIAEWLDSIGLPTKKGGKWNYWTVKSMLLAPGMAGLRVHKGKVIGKGNWKPIIPPDMHYALKAYLSQPVTIQRKDGKEWVRNPARPRRTKYLYTGGYARCGLCRKPLACRGQYRCIKENGGCGGIGIAADRFEAHVAKVIKDYLLTDEVKQRFVATDPDAETREALLLAKAAREAERDEYAQQVLDGEISLKMAASLDKGITAAIGKIDHELASLRPPLPPEFDPEAAAMTWDKLTLEEKRAIFARMELRVVVLPAVKKGGQFGARRIRVFAFGKRIERP